MMISDYFFLLLPVVLSAYPESPHHVNLPYSFPITYPNSSSSQLGIFTPVWPLHEVSTNLPLHEVSINPPLCEVSINLPQYEVDRIALSQNEVFKTVLPQIGGFEIVPVNYQLFNKVKNILSYVLNLGVKGINI